MTELPPGWAQTTLGSICSPPQYGWTTSAVPDGNGLRFLRTTDITKGPVNWDRVPFCAEQPPHPEQYQLAAGDIVISRAGSVGFSAYLDRVDPSVFASYLIRFRPVSSVNGRYIGWFLKSPAYWRQIGEAVSGITLANVNAKKLAAVQLPLAPAAEQERIVAAIEEQFSRLDAGIAALVRVRRNLKRMQASALESAITGHPSSKVQGPLPTGWRWRELRDLCTSITDGDHQPPPRAPDGVPFLVIGDMRSGSLSFENCRYVPHEYYNALHPARRPRKGDVLYTLVGSFGISVLLTHDRPFCVQRHIGILRPSDTVDPAYLAAALASRVVFAQASACATGTAQLTVPLSGLRRILVPVPPREEQEEVVSRLDGQLVAASRLDEAVALRERQAAALRSSILAAAFSGQLVPQDPSDEPASVLLERIAAGRAALSPNGRRPTRKPHQGRLRI